MRMSAVLLLAATVGWLGSEAEIGAGARTPVHPPPDSLPPLARFLVGTWRCNGGTPAGRVLTSEVHFSTTLGDHFLESTHRDDPPGRYMSTSLWPTKSGTPLSTVIYDNFGGSRRFSTGAWSPDSLTWVRDTTEADARMETFTYRRVDDSRYWYGWHVRRAPGAPMVLGDSATCNRRG
jgi:hypothetical protein